MTPAQLIAYSNPCFVAEETMNPSFAHPYVMANGWIARVILTANIGEE